VLSGQEDGEHQRIVRRVLDRTRAFRVDDERVQAVIVRDRVWQNGELIEDTFDYVAQSDDGAVRYLGEDVDEIRNGNVVGHGGSWLYGRDTQVIGVLMPAHPRVGDSWSSEAVPGITNEADRMVDRLRRVKAHRRSYEHAIVVREHAQPDDEIEHKVSARGVGVILELPPDGNVGLRRCERS
jgi:hypothetical protein